MAECGVMPATFMEALASAVRKDPITGKYFLGVQYLTVTCATALPGVACGEEISDPDSFLVSKIFDVDDCGNIIMNIGSEPAAL
jgi:hypothetical protein